MLRKLLSHAAIYGLAAQLPRVAGVLALPIITPYLTTTDYGVAGVVTAYVTALGVVQSLGLSVVLANAFVKHPTRYKWVWRQVGGLMSVWSLMFGILLFCILYLSIPAEADIHRVQIALLFSVPTMFFSAADIQSNLYFQLAQKPMWFALRAIIVGMAAVGVNICTIAFMELGYMGWFYSHFFAMVLAFFFNAYTAYYSLRLWPILRVKWRRVRSYLSVSLPVLPHYVASGMLSPSDRLVLDVVKVPVPQIGLYSIAATFGAYFNQISIAVSEATNSFYLLLLSKNNQTALQQIRDLTFALALVYLVITFTGSLWMKEVFQVLIRNEQLQTAYPLAIILLMGYNFRPFYTLLNNLMLYHEKTEKLWRISTLAVIGNIGLSIALVPLFGYEVVAFTTFAALMYMGYAGMWSKEFAAYSQANYYPLRWLSINLLVTAIAYYAADLALLHKTALSGGGLLAALFTYRKYKAILRSLS